MIAAPDDGRASRAATGRPVAKYRATSAAGIAGPLIFALCGGILLWLLSLKLRDVSIVDIFWGPGIAGVVDIAASLGHASGPRTAAAVEAEEASGFFGFKLFRSRNPDKNTDIASYGSDDSGVSSKNKNKKKDEKSAGKDTKNKEVLDKLKKSRQKMAGAK